MKRIERVASGDDLYSCGLLRLSRSLQVARASYKSVWSNQEPHASRHSVPAHGSIELCAGVVRCKCCTRANSCASNLCTWCQEKHCMLRSDLRSWRPGQHIRLHLSTTSSARHIACSHLRQSMVYTLSSVKQQIAT